MGKKFRTQLTLKPNAPFFVEKFSENTSDHQIIEYEVPIGRNCEQKKIIQKNAVDIFFLLTTSFRWATFLLPNFVHPIFSEPSIVFNWKHSKKLQQVHLLPSCNGLHVTSSFRLITLPIAYNFNRLQVQPQSCRVLSERPKTN